jgi:hypothetical protein
VKRGVDFELETYPVTKHYQVEGLMLPTRPTKGLFACLTLTLVLLTFAGPQPASSQTVADCPVDLNAYWQLEEASGTKFADFTGLNDGVCASSCPIPVSTGKIGGSQQFRRSSATGINVPGDSFNWGKSGSFSIEFWMKKDTACSSGNEVIVGRNDSASSVYWWVGVECAASPQGRVAFTWVDNQGTALSAHSTTLVTGGLWHHVVAVRDGAAKENRIYVDGKLEGQVPAGYLHPFDATATNLTLGWLAPVGYYYSGILDELAIYNRVLSLQEIRSHYYIVRRYCDYSAAPARIMPLGDSITFGMDAGPGLENDAITEYMVGYRRDLWNSLKTAGYDIDFVGSMAGGQYYQTTEGFDVDNEGHGGYRAYQIADGISGWLALNPPEVVLLHIGTNSVTADPTDVEQILNEIDLYSKDITVILARIINRSCITSQPPCYESTVTTDFNNNLAAMAQDRIALGDKIIVVDQENGAGIDYRLSSAGGDMYNDLHPFATGQKKMAAVWFNALNGLLPVNPNSAPTITSMPLTSASPGHTYSYLVTATGAPAPTYSLLTSPPDMVIDPQTGQISWTPAVAGTYDVTVRAQNTLGQDDQNFTIGVFDVAACPVGMISYWKLDETQGSVFSDYYDAHSAECAGACPVAESSLVAGAQTFNGANSGIDVPAHASFNWGAGDSFSIEYWVKKNVAPSNNEVAVGRDSAASALHWWTGIAKTGEATFVLHDTDPASLGGELYGTTNLVDGSWHHIVAVRDAGSGQNLLYVDGALEGSMLVSYSAGFDSLTAAINIGWLNLGTGFRFLGDLDEVAIYGRALDLPEIQQHYSDGLAGLGYCPVPARPLPKLTIKAVDRSASEAGKDIGRFRISRSGETSGALKVKYTITGTAKNGKDYRKLSKRVTIPPNQSSLILRVKPIDDTIKEGRETVKVLLSKSSAYTLGNPRHATVVIKDPN